MKAVLQRVNSARVQVGCDEISRIGVGLLVFVGVGKDDGPSDVEFIARKISEVRVFDDDSQRMTRSVTDVAGEVLIVSQFTLYGDCRRGRRPSFDGAARPDQARLYYEMLVTKVRENGLKVKTGEFQTKMKVDLLNDGPVTLLIDSLKVK